MKRLCINLLLLAMLTGFVSSAANDGDDPVVIVVNPGNEVGHGPRSTGIPIQGYVYDGSIYLFFSDNLGLVNVDVTEFLMGHILHTVVDSSESCVVIPFSGEEGIYQILFKLDSNISFISSFTIQ